MTKIFADADDADDDADDAHDDDDDDEVMANGYCLLLLVEIDCL